MSQPPGTNTVESMSQLSVRDRMSRWLCLAFFVSGAAALLFETLWFRHAGLALGNSIWASSMVLTSFMGGLALGNAAAIRSGSRLKRPLLAYAALEGIVALAGTGIVWFFPQITLALRPVFVWLSDRPLETQAVRLLASAGVLLLPTTAMGVTLPLLTRALVRRQTSFGAALGRLYGWNTLGGVAGALVGEAFLIGRFGLRGTALTAALCNLMAGGISVWLSRRFESGGVTPASLPAQPSLRRWQARLPLLAAFVCGAALLALEVVWFRFLQLFFFGTQMAFAAMLAVVLGGIGVGGLVAGRWLARRDDAWIFSPIVALAAGLATAYSFVFFDPRIGPAVYHGNHALRAIWLSLILMFPTAFGSGILFALLGRSLREHIPSDMEATGALTLANTLGAMLGSLAGGFLLLPRLGVGRSLLALVVAYGIVAVATVATRASVKITSARQMALIGMAVLYLVSAALFPVDLMRSRFVRLSLERFTADGSRVVAYREGLNETIDYLRFDWGGQPLFHRLITNGHPMSGTTFYGQRYMKLFAYLGLALYPQCDRALLISYGVGSTAKALTDTQSLRTIDIVDTSREILEMSDLIFDPPQSSPLHDRRVRVHVEDGRFFLATTRDRFDLITAEPPPPQGAGIVNLYSLEYFALIRDRLTEGGIATYWLPVAQLPTGDTRAVVSAFCTAFPDCALWNGAGLDWILTGTRGPGRPLTEEGLTRQWKDPQVAPTLARLGLEAPEQLGALFIADSRQLAGWVAGTPPLNDDHPGRLSPNPPRPTDLEAYQALADCRETERRFASSPYIDRVWPSTLRQRSKEFFAFQCAFDDDYAGRSVERRIERLHQVLTGGSLRTLALLLLDSEPAVVNVARRASAAGESNAYLSFHLGAGALADRDYAAAAGYFAQAMDRGSDIPGLRLYRALATALSGQPETALRDLRDFAPAREWEKRGKDWLIGRLAVDRRASP